MDRLEKISESVNLPVEDEFDLFGKHIACQLRQLPLHKALHIQQQFQSMLTDARIAAMTTHPSTDHLNFLSNGPAPFSSFTPTLLNERPSDILGEAMRCLNDDSN